MLLLPGDGERVLCGAAAQIFIGKRSLARALHRRRSCSVRAVLRVAGTVAQGHEQRFVGPPFLPDAVSVGGYKETFVLLLFPPFKAGHILRQSMMQPALSQCQWSTVA